MKRLRGIALAVIILAIVLLVFAAQWYFTLKHPDLTSWADRGAFGDMFGAVNALFTGLAFAGLMFTIYQQRQELSLQRTELEQTRQELRGQKEQLAIQNATLEQQQFEHSYFQLLGFHNHNAYSMSISSGGRTVSGKECFETMYRDLYNALDQKRGGDSSRDMTIEVNRAYGEIYQRYQHLLSHYFQNLYSLIQFVDHNNSVRDKEFYMSFIRAQLSTYELLLLFYHCLSDYGRARYKPLVEIYQLLKYLPVGLVVMPEHLELYKRARSA